MRAWQAGDRAAAVEIWQTHASAGDAEASLFLGYLYRNGIAVPRDEKAALHWYRRAAELGQAEAQYELGLMYELGIGVAPDPGEAAMWYGLSSAQACPGELRAGGRLGDR
jgi:TPR repeat protein